MYQVTEPSVVAVKYTFSPEHISFSSLTRVRVSFSKTTILIVAVTVTGVPLSSQVAVTVNVPDCSGCILSK